MAENIISIDDSELRTIAKSMRRVPGAIGRVIPRGINKTLDKANTDIISEVHDETHIKKKAIRKSIIKYKANQNKWYASIDPHESRRIKLIEFGMPKYIKKKQHDGQSYFLHGQQQHIPYHRQFSPVFKTRMKTGHVGVYKRIRHGSLWRIIELKGPSLPVAIAGYSGIVGRVVSRASENLYKNITTQMDLEIDRQLKKKK